MLTEEQKTQCLKCARELLKRYKGCNSRVISNLLTGDETWVHMFEPQRRADNKQWKRKDQKRSCCQENHKFEKDVVAIFFNSSWPVVQVPCPSGHKVTGRFYKNSVLKKVKDFYNKKLPSNGWSGVHLLHYNASSHKCEVVKKKVREKSRECHNHKPQPFPDPKRKREPTSPNKHKSNKRTKSTKISSLFPKRGNRNTKRTEKHKNKMTHGKTYNKSPRRINHKAKKSKINTGTTPLERSVE